MGTARRRSKARRPAAPIPDRGNEDCYVNSGHHARHRADRATLTEVIRAAAQDAPKGAGRSAVVVATVGGIALSALAPAGADALDSDDLAKRAVAEEVIRLMYAPVVDVHWVTVKQLAQCEPTLVETVACMIGDLLKEALHEAVHTMGIPEPAARSILLGHTQVALANSLQGDNPFSDACLIAMRYGRNMIVKDDWKRIFEDEELDRNLQQMLHLPEPIRR